MRKQVCHALKEYGCFVVELSHKVSLQLHNKIFDAVGELFDFPTETKKKKKIIIIIIAYEKPFHGYASSALHERLVIEEEGFEIYGHLYQKHIHLAIYSYVK
ncbi:putative 2-oxoglutarate-dependent dioxygenase aop1 [Quercus suber]|uniref:2-oxoglutarate-dependent dioxygenase aop1 n=1 Tax=Quercus suber TaxID=58331 RepID=A0AAW0MBG9_QUESU